MKRSTTSQGITVIVCCYNSERRLPETLKYIAAQQVDPDLKWEVILINNNSSDNTARIALQTWTRYSLPTVGFRIIDEPKAGLSHARERGMKESLYDYLLFCDDDNWLSPHYLRIGFHILTSKPEVGAIGGKGIEAPEIEPPDWFKTYRLTYAVGPHSEKSGDITHSRGDVYGAGAFFRKEALTKLYGNEFKSLLLDRTGRRLTSGGDSELCICVRLLGYRIWYDERLIFHHFIPKERLTPEYFIELHKGISRGLTQLLPYYFLSEPAISYETRNWIRKQWLWFFASRLIHLFTSGLIWNLLQISIKTKITEKNLRAVFFYESMKTLLLEGAHTTKKYAMIRNSRWYRQRQTD